MGQTEGADQVEIRSQVSGILKRQLYKEGEFVRRGQPLFIIDQAPFQADLEAARAAANQAKAQLEQADRELARTRRLYAQQAVPQKDLDDAQSTAKVARAALKAAEAKAAASSISLSHTQITAPADGIAGMALVNPGTLVTAQSTQLTTLTQKKDLKVVFAISDRDLGNASMTLGNAVEVVNSDGKRIPAKLDYVSQSVTPDLGTRQMRARSPPPPISSPDSLCG